MPCERCTAFGIVVIEEDHWHHFKNVLNEDYTCWWIDGQEFNTLGSMKIYLKRTYGLDVNETIDFLRTIPKIYN